MRAEGRAENKFPVLWSYRDPKPHEPQWVPWDWMELHSESAYRNHRQTIQRLAERGGLGADEIWCAVHGAGLWDAGVPTPAAAAEWLRSKPWAARAAGKGEGGGMSFDESKWSSVIIEPSLWWRIRALLKRPTIIFSWGQDKYTIRGLIGEEVVSAGGVPTAMRDELRRSMASTARAEGKL